VNRPWTTIKTSWARSERDRRLIEEERKRKRVREELGAEAFFEAIDRARTEGITPTEALDEARDARLMEEEL